MLVVAEINYIRHEVNSEGHSYADVAKRMGKDPRTIKKYADQEDFNAKEIKQKRPSRVMDAVKPILEKWIQEDLNRKKKFRRTARRMYDLLVEQFAFKGSERSVRLFVSEKKKELLNQADQASLPLEARAGSAEVDFGKAPFKYRGKQVELSYLVMSFPYSNSFYFQVFPAQNIECFLEGMKRIFHYIGGVPRFIRFDNLTPAVKKVLPQGKRILTEIFQNFILHYGFACEFCNPRHGNEKGNVENRVGYVRNNFLLPELTIQSLAEVNQQTWKWAENDRNRKHYVKHESIAKLYLTDRDHFLQLPEKEFECAEIRQAHADKYGYVTLDHKYYSTSPRFAQSTVMAKVFFNQVRLLTETSELIVVHERLYGEKERSMIWQPYLSLMAKRPNALKYTSFYDQLPAIWKQFLSACTLHEKQSVLRLLSELLKEQDFSLCTRALTVASVHGHPSTENIKQIYYQLKKDPGSQRVFRPRIVLPKVPAATRGLKHYDQLYVDKGGGHSWKQN